MYTCKIIYTKRIYDFNNNYDIKHVSSDLFCRIMMFDHIFHTVH